MATPQPDMLVNPLYVLNRDRALCLVMLDLIQDHAEDLASLDTTQHKDLLFAIASTLAHLKRNLEDTHQELCVWLEAIPPTGDNHTQLIFATHDTNLLDQDLFHKSQIWFAEKDQVGGTHLASLLEYKNVRTTDNIGKHYIQGKYGAIPYVGTFQPELS